MSKASIFVTGDLIRDNNIIRFPGQPKGYSSPNPVDLDRQELGGAWYVTDLLNAISNPETGYIGCPNRKLQKPAASAFTVWQLRPTQKGDKATCWRISEFIGCKRPDSGADASQYWSELEPGSTLVLDDVGVSFAEKDGPWTAPEGKASLQAASNIIGKAGYMGSPLWQHLLNDKQLSNKLTIVVSAEALREAGARVSRSLSWEATIEDLRREVEQGQVGAMFAGCRRVIVLFGVEGLAVFTREPRVPEEDEDTKRQRFVQFLYDPLALEGSIAEQRIGTVTGALSIVLAAATLAEVDPIRFPRFIWLSRALSALQNMRRQGAGANPKTGPTGLMARIKDIARNMHEPGEDRPEDYFGVSFPRELLDNELNVGAPLACDDSLLTDLTGTQRSLVRTKAEEIVVRGEKKALPLVPCAEYGNYITFDRDEIERINSLRNLISSYLAGGQPTPLSVAVFGEPGSGKSFAIKQLSRSLFPGAISEVTFNLSQFKTVQELHSALHQVRDMTLSGTVPLVFWDEFDANDLEWLKDFLAPMQDGEFNQDGHNHPVGRAIFIFAGGTAHSFEEFAETHAENKPKKAPDFISRLRGFVNVKGPNKVGATDELYVIRRALLLRAFLDKYAGKDKGKGLAQASQSVLKGLLFAEKYEHGARSMESIVAQCRVQTSQSIGPSDLPPKELLHLHISDDFIDLVDAAQQLDVSQGGFADILAKHLHESWMAEKLQDGWSYGAVRDDKAKKNPYLLPFDELEDEGRERNLAPARVALARIEALGLQIKSSNVANFEEADIAQKLSSDEFELLARIEHHRWMRERMRQGYVFGHDSNDKSRVHRDIRAFDKLSERVAALDRQQVRAILQILQNLGMVIVREPKIDKVD